MIRQAGFTIIEMMIATAMMMAVMGAIFTVTNPAQGAFQAQGEVADMQQRLRAAVDVLGADLRMADAVRPYRVGGARDDSAAGVYYRPDTISVFYPSPQDTSALAARTYYLKGAASNTFELMQYDGRQADLPVVDHVARLAFEYFGDPERLDPSVLTDGPWREDGSHRRFDADLLRVRHVRVHLGVESAIASLRGPAGALFAHGGSSTAPERLVPDQEIELHITMRNTGDPRP